MSSPSFSTISLFNRQEDIFKLHGDEIPRSTQCSWLATVAELLEPLHRRMATQVLSSRKIHTDDTPIRVLAPGTGKTRTARFWVYLGDAENPFTLFDYTPTRSRTGPQEFLRLQGLSASRRLCGLRPAVRGPERDRSGLLGAHSQKVFRSPLIHRSRVVARSSGVSTIFGATLIDSSP